MTVTKAFFCFWGTLAYLAASDTFSITQDRQLLPPDESVTFQILPTTAGASITADWKVSPMISGAVPTVAASKTSLTYTAPGSGVGSCVQVTVTATSGMENHTASVVLTPFGVGNRFDPQEPCPGGIIAVAIIGFEQAGATSAKAEQKFFFDIFDSRPLPIFNTNGSSGDPIYGPRLRWWGNVRIATYPQQISSPVGQFDIATQLSKVPVNQLAGFGEFRAGLERRIGAFSRPFLPLAGGASERTTLGLIGYFGGLANLTSPSQRVDVFDIPSLGTPQRQAFDSVFPVSQYPVLAAPQTHYVGLTAPDHQSFYWEYAAGFRLTTRYFDPDGTALAAPAIFAATFGQNELVTGGHRRGVVGVFEGFYPLPVGPRGKNANMFYLFGRADIRLGRANIGSTPLVLNPAVDSNNVPIPATNANVGIIALPSNRDLYSIGVGLDAIQVINAIKNKANPTTTK